MQLLCCFLCRFILVSCFATAMIFSFYDVINCKLSTYICTHAWICIEIAAIFIAQMILQISEYVKENYIKTRYFAQEGIWQLLQPKHFVNVLLIHHMKQHSEKELIDMAALMREGLTRGTHRTSNSDKKKHEIDSLVKTHNISDIFKPLQKPDGTTVIPEVMVIDGAPGMGKTTLSKEIAYQWAKGQLLNDKSIIFFIYLRDPELRQIYDLQSFIHYFYNFDKAAFKFSQQCADVLIKRNNKDITIILDGYDEYFDMSGKSFITLVLNRKVFTQSKLVITSRPIATDKLQHIADIRVEVMGFTDNSKQEYIVEELKHSPNKMKRLLMYLDVNKTINSICYIPMIMTILVCTFKESEELPTDQTELYKRFITLAICRYVQKLENNPKSAIFPLQRLPELYQQYIIELSKFAFDSLKDDKIVFTEEDIETLCPNLASANKNFQGLGLLKSAQYFSMKRIENCYSYNFLHLSIQEFLAAFYINSLEASDQFKLLKRTFFVKKYTNTWTLFAGLNKSKMTEFFEYLIYGIPCKEIKNKSMPKVVSLDPIQAFIQMVNICIDDHTLIHCKLFCYKNSEVELYKEDTLSNRFDSFILLSERTASKVDWNKVYLSLCCARNKSLETFVIDKSKQEGVYVKIALQLSEITHLSVVIVNAVSMVAYRATKQQIIDGFNMNDSISHITMRQCNVDEEAAEKMSLYFSKSYMTIAVFIGCTLNVGGVLFHGLSSINTLQMLFLRNTGIDENAAVALSSVISNNNTLFQVEFLNCNLQKGARKIVAALKNISTVSTLGLSENRIPGSVADDLAVAIYVNYQLKRLLLADNNLQHHGAVVASALCHIGTLVELDLSNNNMTKIVADELALAIENNKSLQELNISGNKLTTDGIIKISQSISSISNLRILDISNNQITERAADAIAHAISSNNGLEQLYLSSNKMCAGVLMIATALMNLSSLKILALNDNEISTVAASKIASAIMSNSSLEDLRLRNNNLMTSGIITIAKSLSYISTLKILDIHKNWITEEATDALSLAILSNTKIEQLYLGNNNFQVGILKVLDALKSLRMLKCLGIDNTFSNVFSKAKRLTCTSKSRVSHLRGNKLQSCSGNIVEASFQSTNEISMGFNDINIHQKIANTLADVISNNTSLQTLWSNNNNIKSDEIITIATSLSNLTSLNTLDLRGNWITEEAADALASVILRNGSLAILILGDNDLRAGVLTLVASLRNVLTLREMYIGHNSIPDKVFMQSSSFITNPHLEVLNLSYNCIQLSGKFVAQGLSKINTLTKLYLHDCHMTITAANTLAAAFTSNSSLKTLLLRNNQLQTSGVVTICQSLKCLSTLQEFNISCNEVTEQGAYAIASVVLSNVEVKQLFLGDNKLHNSITKITRALQTVSSVVILYLSYMEMTDRVAPALEAAINNNHLLEQLYVAGNLLSNSLVDVIKACKRSVKNLITLDLRCNLVNPSKLSDMASVISSIDTLVALFIGGLVINDNEKFFNNFVLKYEQLHPQVNAFDMNLNKEYEILEVLSSISQRETIQNYIKMNYQFDYLLYIEADPMTGLFNGHLSSKYDYLNIKLQRTKQDLSQVDAATIIYLLPVISKLKVLDLEQSNIDEVAAFELGAILSCNNVLEQLWLSGNQLEITGAMFILNSLEHMSTLAVLDLSFNDISYQSADGVAAVIKSNPRLEQLWLDGNGLLDVGVKQICHALHCVTNLRILSLCSNGITDDAAEELSNAVFANNMLEDVSLGNNKLQSVGICKIIHSFNNLCQFRILDLVHNGVNKDAADELGVLISNCYTLQSLYLSDNMLDTEGAIKIFESLKHKSKLQVLTLSNNNITDEAIDELCLVLAQNPRLQVLLLGGNKLQTDGVVKIAQVVKCENTIMRLLALCNNNISEQGKEEVDKLFSDNTFIHVYM